MRASSAQGKPTGRPRQFASNAQVLVLSGYGLRVSVHRGHLVLEDGIAGDRRIRRLSRVDQNFNRIAIIGHAGTITLDAVRWLYDARIPLVHLDVDGRLLAMIAPHHADHPVLRRAQVKAGDSELGLALMRHLLRLKLDGQERVLRSFTAGQLAIPYMEIGRRALDAATDLPSLRGAEGRAAAAYWGTWSMVEADFKVTTRKGVPDHWLRFGQRSSPLSGSPRVAVNPLNAMLNYAYSILETEARLALLAVGCDPGVGLMHADAKSRDSMACDLMEAVRPDIDEVILTFAKERTLRPDDFVELRNGQCRLMPRLARELAQLSSLCATRLAPVAERVAEAFYSGAITQPKKASARTARSRRKELPTPLTERNRRRQFASIR